MKKLVAAMVAAGMAVACAGCGGGAKTETTASQAPETTKAESQADTSAAADGDVRVISICDSQPASSLIGQAIGESFANALAEKSGGKMKVEYYPAAQL